MCLAIYKLENITIDRDRLKDAFTANPDSWGLMWVEDGAIQVKRGLDWDGFIESYEPIETKSLVIHFRTASSGEISVDNAHPIFVNPDLAFVQNGNLFEYSQYFAEGRYDNETDVHKFNREVLKRLPRNFLDLEEIRDALETYNINNMSRMIFMDSLGNISIIGEELGEWYNGAWYSNGGLKDYVGYGFSGAYPYNEGDKRHKGGLISVCQFDDSETWYRCPSCLGYYKNLTDICDSCNIWNNLLIHGL